MTLLSCPQLEPSQSFSTRFLSCARFLRLRLNPCLPSHPDPTPTPLRPYPRPGPEDTPYSGGCFIFDIFFPPEYPDVAPQVNLCTTGGGRVRFNPNLYNCGKVCLSLLGTWQGGRGEGWEPHASTMVQVLISIQSLILVPAPYFNEPGYERTMHTPAGDASSHAYSLGVQTNNIRYAMLDLVKSPKPEFAEVIRKHFHLRKVRRGLNEPPRLAVPTPTGHGRRLKRSLGGRWACAPVAATATRPPLS